MRSYLHKHRFLMITIFFSLGFWFFESLLHFFIFDQSGHFEFIPHDLNEFWMRIIICVLIIIVGFIADRYIIVLQKVHDEKLRTLKATMFNVQDIAGNALNQVSLYCAEAEDIGEFDSKSVEYINSIVLEATEKLRELGDIDKVAEEKNSQGIYKIKVTQSNNEDQVT